MVFRVASGGGSSGLVIGAGATPISGGTASRVLFEGATNVLSESADLTFAATTGILTVGGTTAGSGLVLTSGTLTGGSSPVLSATQTWNNGATLFKGLVFTATDTASAATSLLFQLNTGVTEEFSVRKDGVVRMPVAIVGGSVFINGDGNQHVTFSYTQAEQLRFDKDYIVTWSATANGPDTSIDFGLSRISAGLLGIGTGAAGSFAGRLQLTSTITAAVAVGSLNASPTIGEVQTVNDALAIAAKGAIVAAGGTAVCQVMWNGANWVGI